MISLPVKDGAPNVAAGLKDSFTRVELSGESFGGGARDNGPPEMMGELSFRQKAAIIISTLGPEASAVMLRSLNEEEVRVFARASTSLEDIPKDVIDHVILEFMQTLDKEGLAMTPDKLKRILGGVMSDDQIERIFEDMDEAEGRSIWDKLSNSDVVELGNFLAREHPQTVAVVISKIKPEKAARIMMRFEDEFADEVVMRLSKVQQLQPNVLDSIRETLHEDFLRTARQSKSKRKPDELIGSIMNFMTNEKRDKFIGTIKEQSETLAIAVQRKMFTFSDIPARVDRANISTIVREIDNAVLCMALKTAEESDPETVEYFFGNMSKRLAEQLQETVDEMPKPSAKEGEDAQFAVIDLIRRLSDRGVFKLNLGEEGDDDGF